MRFKEIALASLASSSSEKGCSDMPFSVSRSAFVVVVVRMLALRDLSRLSSLAENLLSFLASCTALFLLSESDGELVDLGMFPLLDSARYALTEARVERLGLVEDAVSLG
jgi:hypothetical protein